MRICETCGSEMKERTTAYHLFACTFKISLGIAIFSSLFGSDSLVDFGVDLMVIIPYISLVLYPFKLGRVYKCTNGDCKEVHYENTKQFVCGHCESEDNVKRKKKTTKITLIGMCLVIISCVMPSNLALLGISRLLFIGGLGLNILAVILEKMKVFDVLLECKHCGRIVSVKKEKVDEYGL